jgi:DUF3047 family protein
MTWNAKMPLRLPILLAVATVVSSAAAGAVWLHAQGPNQVLEDFGHPDDKGWPAGWKAQRSETRAKEAYQVKTEGEQAFLSAKGADQRVYKKIGWDPKDMPIVSWKWRLTGAPAPESEKEDLIAAVFVSLDTDLMFIPVTTKYVWSRTKPVGTITEGGMSSASEIVLRSGTAPVGEWTEERVNAYVDFKRIHNHEPADKAWGISLLAGPGVEVDFGPIAVHSP